MRTRILALLIAPLLLLAGCGDQLATAPQEALYHHSPGHGGGDEQGLSDYALLALDTRWSQTTGINDAGIVVGRKVVADQWVAALWTGDEVATTLGIPRSSFAGINSPGVAIGWEADDLSSNYAIHRRGFLYRNAEIVPISGEHLDEYGEFGEVFFTGSLDDDRVQPWDINDHGIVIARALFPIGDGRSRRYAFSWQEGSAITYIRNGQPTAINNAGQVVGFEWYTNDPVVWEVGSYDEPKIVPGLRDHFPGYEIELKSINDGGQILGLACRRDDGRALCDSRPEQTYDRRGFVLDGGRVVELPLPNRGVELTSLGGLDENGRVVGTVRKREGGNTNWVPVLWTVNAAGAAVQELPRGGHTHAHAIAINGHGQVAGHANPWEALVWTPGGGGDDGGSDDDGGCTHPKGKCK